MRDNTVTNGLLCTWVVVTDEGGRTHMEARWTHAHASAAHAA
jgi:hypothetical protein